MAGYEKITPGFADRILKMTELETYHRRELESTHLKAEIKHQEREDWEVKLGQIFAFLIAIIAIITGAILVMHGYQYAGSFISTLGLGTIVTAFLNTRKPISETKEPNSKTNNSENIS